MPHDFSNEINAAFAAFEERRAKSVDLPPMRFEFGPYFPPRVAVGDEIECARFGLVRMTGWSDGPLPWPQCRRSSQPSMILFADLERAVKVESANAVAAAWGVWPPQVSKWRQVLGVERSNPGTVARSSRNFPVSIPLERHLAGLKLAREPAAILRADKSRRAHGHLGNQHPWSAEEIGWLGVLTDKQVAERLGCNKLTVARERRRRGIATTGPIGYGSNLLPLDSARLRARRLALGLTQPAVAERIGRGARRIAQLESGETARVKPTTLDALARALECQPDDLRAIVGKTSATPIT